MTAWLRRLAPSAAKDAARRLLLRWQINPGRMDLTGRGTVHDLYFWMADGRVETNVLLNNFYSVFFPMLDTATTGSLTVLDADGRRLGRVESRVGHLGCVTFKVSQLLREWFPNGRAAPTEGTLLFDVALPEPVISALAHVQGAFYFWHRFYIEYVTREPVGQPAFVHCVDRTVIRRHGAHREKRWYTAAQPRDWSPEPPININDYRRLSVILMNRAPRAAAVTLTVTDSHDQTRAFTQTIPTHGVRRFLLTPERLQGLVPLGLRLRVVGMPTTWARPVLFKEFRNGTISTMHC